MCLWHTNRDIPKYYKYFEEWFAKLTDNQIEYFTAYMKGKKHRTMNKIEYGTYEIPKDSFVELYMDGTMRIFPPAFKRGDIVKMSNGSFDQPYVFMGVRQNKCMLVDKKGCLHYVNGNAGIWESTFENATLSCTKEQKEQLRQFINKVKNGML